MLILSQLMSLRKFCCMQDVNFCLAEDCFEEVVRVGTVFDDEELQSPSDGGVPPASNLPGDGVDVISWYD